MHIITPHHFSSGFLVILLIRGATAGHSVRLTVTGPLKGEGQEREGEGYEVSEILFNLGNQKPEATIKAPSTIKTRTNQAIKVKGQVCA